MITIASLIERLEKATGPDREIDLAIHRLMRKCRPSEEELKLERLGRLTDFDGFDQVFVDSDVHDGGYCLGVRRVNFTSSIDVAMTLVREDQYLERLSQVPAGWNAMVSDKIDDSKSWEAVELPTPAIALCIAGLKALEASHG